MSKIMRTSPVAGARPTDLSTSPMQHAASTPTIDRPTIDRPNKDRPNQDRPNQDSMNNSAEPNSKINGCAISTKPVSTTAPNSPPNSLLNRDDAKAGDSARRSALFGRRKPVQHRGLRSGRSGTAYQHR
jgi:hypothetical protein